ERPRVDWVVRLGDEQQLVPDSKSIDRRLLGLTAIAHPVDEELHALAAALVRTRQLNQLDGVSETPTAVVGEDLEGRGRLVQPEHCEDPGSIRTTGGHHPLCEQGEQVL